MLETETEKSALTCIDLILAHKKDFISNFLKERAHPSYGTKETQRDLLNKLVIDGKISKEELLAVLDESERFGNQHIYLFLIPQYLTQLSDSAYVMAVCERLGLKDIFNAQTPCTLPEKPSVINITYNDKWLNICWAEQKSTYALTRTRLENRSGSEFCIKEYLITKYRAIVSFRVSLITGNAELMIYRQPSGSNYEEVKDQYLRQLSDWFGLEDLTPLDLYKTINAVEGSNEVTIRRLGLRTARGSQIDITSASEESGISDDPDAQNARKTVRTSLDTGKATNCYWLPDKTHGALKQKLHTKIYRDRIAIMRECHQSEVEHVLGWIRHHLSKIP